jgi:hypothetical protein
LTCQIDTSNILATGYAIQVWDEENNLVFPVANEPQISPLSELIALGLGTGLNGTTLTIPFFQLLKAASGVSTIKLKSYNAIYCVKSYDSANTCSWQDIDGNPVSGFAVSGRMYKWAVTLYQGIGVVSTTPAPLSISYSSLDSKYYDMKLSSGTVLGSTNKRIQFAQIDSSGNFVLPDSSVVLQGRYMQLYTAMPSEATGNVSTSWRAYVESYDSTYAHAYPVGTWSAKYAQNIVDDAKCVAFYKYANDPDYIKASEEVALATDSPLSCLQSGGLPLIGGSAVVDGDLVLVKDQGENDAYENGVYIAHALGVPWERVAAYDTWAEFIGVVVYVQRGKYGGTNWMSQAQAGGTLLTKAANLYGVTADYLFANVSSVQQIANLTSYGSTTFEPEQLGILGNSYDSTAKQVQLVKFLVTNSNVAGNWTTFGAKSTQDNGTDIAFCLTGGVVDVNATSKVVDTTTYPLYSPLRVSTAASSNVVTFSEYPGAASSYSRLYFQPEEPIVLFGDSVAATVTYLIVGDPNASGATFDGYSSADIRTGQTCLRADTMQIYSASLSGSAVVWTAQTQTYDASKLYSVQAGVTYGGKTWTSINGGSGNTPLGVVSYAASVAQVLHNDSSHTYVSPYAGMQPLMRISFKNGQTVTTNIGGTEQSGVTGLTVQDIDSKVWRITHAALANASTVSATGGLPSAATANFPNAPYKYDLLSFFQQSDDNPFYTYSVPVISIRDANTDDSPNNISYSNMASSEIVTWDVNTRKISVAGNYAQNQGASWESYQWELFDDAGNSLQSTDKRYDNAMAAVFYGLADDSSYAIALTVTDSLGNVLTWTQPFSVGQVTTAADIPFTATPECDLQCVKLDYQDIGIMWPSMTVDAGGTIDFIYDADNEAVFNQVGRAYDYSLGYENQSAYAASYLSMALASGLSQADDTANDRITAAPVHEYDYAYDGECISNDPLYLSSPIRNGLKYAHYFPTGVSSVVSNAASSLLRLESSVDGSDNLGSCNNIAMQTQINLGADACGQIFSLNIGSLQGGSSTGSSTGIKLSVYLPDCLTYSIGSTETVSLNPSRANVMVGLAKGATSFVNAPTALLSADGVAYSWFSPVASGNAQQYYLQYSDVTVPSGTEMLHYPAFVSDSRDLGSPYYSKTSYVAANTAEFPIGNMLFVGADEAVYPAQCSACNPQGPQLHFEAAANLAAWMNCGAHHGMNMAIGNKTQDGYCYLFGDSVANADLTQYYLNVFEAQSGSTNYQSAPLTPYVRHQTASWVGKAMTFTVTGENLDVLEASDSVTVAYVAGLGDTANVRLSAGTGYIQLSLKVQ